MATLQSEVEKAFYLYDSGQSLELYRDVDGNVQVGIQGAIEEFAQPRTRSEMAQSPEVMAIDPMMGASGRPDPAYLEARASLPMEKQREMFEREAFQAIGAPLGLSIATLMTLPDLISLPPLIAAGMITAEEGKKFENVLNMLKYVPSAQVGEFLKEQGKNLGFSDAQVEAFGEGYLGGELSSIVVNAVPGAKQLVKGAKWLKDSAVDYAAGAPARVAERGTGTVLRSGIDPTELVDDTIVAIQRLSGGATGKRTKTGQYIGAPSGLDTPQKLAALRRKMEQFTVEGEPGRFWYERSSKAILDSVGGDVEDADKLIQAIAILSPSTPVKNNMDFALQAFSQWKAGEPIRTGMYPTAMTKKLEQVFAGQPWEGRKTNNFYVNLMREIDPSRVQGVTTDIHMMRAFGFDTDSPTTAQYDFVEKEVKRIADKFGWEPQQVQAAIWVTQKAKKENRPVELTKYDFADAIGDNLGQVSWESIPGSTSSHMPEMFNAPMEQQAEYHVAVSKAFLDDSGNDVLAKHVGVVSPRDFEAPGFFEGKVSPGTQTQIAIPRQYKSEGRFLEPGAINLVNKYNAMRALLLKQDAAAWHLPKYKAKYVKNYNGYDVDIGRTLTENEIEALGKALIEKSGNPYLAPISTDKGVRIVNFDKDVDNKEFLQMAKQVIAESDLGDVKLVRFQSEGDFYTNDWSKSPNGEDYFRYISGEGSSDLSAGDRVLIEEIQSRIDDIDADFSAKYGWSLNEGINANFRRQSTEVNTGSPDSVPGGDQ